MTFTYTPATPTDRDRIRYAIGDTVSARAMFTDDEIAFALAEGGSWRAGVIFALEGMIVQLASNPNFTAQWLTVSVTEQIKAFQNLLDRKRQQYGIGGIRATTGYAWRPDSLQTEAPTFPETEDDD